MIRVIKAGMQTSIQDGGRTGYLATGLSPAGPMDHLSLRIASLLVGNELPAPLFAKAPPGDAGLEITIVGPTLEFQEESIIALAGANIPARLNGKDVPYYESVHIPAGAMLELGTTQGGARSYLAVAGGIRVEPVLGSRSQNLFAARGPLNGGPLKAGEELPIEPLGRLAKRKAGRRFDLSLLPEMPSETMVCVVLGPQDDLFTGESLQLFLSEPWTLTPAANRVGMRLKGPVLKFRDRPAYLTRDAGPDPSNIVDDVIPVGGIQCPSGIEAIVMGMENPTVGGFAKIATVISADIAILGQMLPGQTTMFKAVSADDAVESAAKCLDLVSECNLL